jgi:hypothetical protein
MGFKMRFKEEVSGMIKVLDKKTKQKCIRSLAIKEKLKEIYALGLPMMQEEDVDKENLEIELEVLNKLSNKDYFQRLDAKRSLKKILLFINDLESKQLKKGVRFREDIKDNVYNEISKHPELSHVLSELKKAEKLIQNKPDDSCMNSREACEELFRVLRIKKVGEDRPRESLTAHASALRGKGLITNTEHQFLSSGLYGFLSGKGKHANTEKKEPRDALFGFKLSLITIEQFLVLF